MLHGYQAESELFRGFCDDLDDEEEEQKRRMAERAQRRTATASREPPAYAQPHISSSAPAEIRTVLEKEHEERRAARQRLLEKDERHQGYMESLVSGTGSSDGVGPAVSKEELEAHLRENGRAMRQETSDFVQTYR
uniref:Uncharacterized protein n=1 Tax=Haptolina ericina TaxID=156174 RepID=A0A7S3B4R7_9EUKA|mmetsp:Transcript_49246/g.110770  ORF Transcript_49246/g.110770 Transcript_49246/m.110770 type:complete len:136 (+) Transcript_49246:46-453(+)